MICTIYATNIPPFLLFSYIKNAWVLRSMHTILCNVNIVWHCWRNAKIYKSLFCLDVSHRTINTWLSLSISLPHTGHTHPPLHPTGKIKSQKVQHCELQITSIKVWAFQHSRWAVLFIPRGPHENILLINISQTTNRQTNSLWLINDT